MELKYFIDEQTECSTWDFSKSRVYVTISRVNRWKNNEKYV